MALKYMYENVKLIVNEEEVQTNIGVIQGGITSPTTFAIAIDDMLRNLNKVAKAYALADDIFCYCKGEYQLHQTIRTLEKTCS